MRKSVLGAVRVSVRTFNGPSLSRLQEMLTILDADAEITVRGDAVFLRQRLTPTPEIVEVLVGRYPKRGPVIAGYTLCLWDSNDEFYPKDELWCKVKKILSLV